MCLTSASDDTNTRTHTNAQANAVIRVRSMLRAAIMVTNAVGVSSNFIACIIHECFNLTSPIRHNMPALLHNREDGNTQWLGVTFMCDIMNSHQKSALSRVWLSKKAVSHQLPPSRFNRLLLWQSSGICLQNCYVPDREVLLLCCILNVLYWIVLCDEHA